MADWKPMANDVYMCKSQDSSNCFGPRLLLLRPAPSSPRGVQIGAALILLFTRNTVSGTFTAIHLVPSV
jgi:hypothetical protein